MHTDPLSIVCPYCLAIPEQRCQNQRGPFSQKVYSGQSAQTFDGGYGNPIKQPHRERVYAARAQDQRNV